ncbi:MAG TPA: glycosyltransferase family 9 protein [Candidatus Limnocylindrales bacterium]|nr:glycosyltransferase family 9 protein [Candidatus Limnocylindrales bacterium]
MQHLVEPPPAAGLLLPEGGSVLLFRALPGVGDLLCAVPAMRAIRSHRPDVHVTLVTLPGTAPLASRFTRYLDEVVEFPGFPGLPDRRPDVRAIPSFLAAMHERRADLAIQLHGIGDRTNDIVGLFGARRTAGFYPRGTPPPEPARYLPWREAEHEIHRWLRLLGHLGLPSDDARLELPLVADAEAQADAVLDDALGGHPAVRLVVVHPGASIAVRRWSPHGFSTVVDRLVAAGSTVVLTGTSRERPITQLVRSMTANPDAVADLAGRTSLDALAAIVRRADLVVTNDTGVSHVAAAMATPSVVVFTDTDPVRWAPLDASLHHAIGGGSTRRVAEEAVRMLRRRRPDAA